MSGADALGHLRLDSQALELGQRRHRRRLHPHIVAVADAAVVGRLRVDLDEHLLLQLGQPRVGARFFAAAFVLDQAAAGHDQRVASCRCPCSCPARVLYSVGRRQNAFLSSCVGYLATSSGRLLYSGSRCCGTGSGKFHTTRTRLGVAERMAAVIDHRHADDAARWIGLPVLAFGGLLLGLAQVAPPAELLQQQVVELGVAGGQVGALAVRTVAGQQVDAVTLDTEVGAEVAAAVHHVLATCRTGWASPDASSPACRSTATAGRSSRRRACSRSPCRCRPWRATS